MKVVTAKEIHEIDRLAIEEYGIPGIALMENAGAAVAREIIEHFGHVSNKKVCVFLAAFLGDLFTYCVTSFQLALAYPSEVGGIGASIAKFLGIFATTQLPLAVIEGILTVVIVIALETYAKDELSSLEF